MKKLLTLLLVLATVFAVTACNLGNAENPNGDDQGKSQTDSQGGNDYDNDGWTKKQRQIIAEEIGKTVEGTKLVVQYYVDEGDTCVYIDVLDEFADGTCRYREWRFCKDKESFDDEFDPDDEDNDVVNEKEFYFCEVDDFNYSWKSDWQSAYDHFSGNTLFFIVE